MDVGAYGASLSSNYNTKPLIAELLVNKGNIKIIRKNQNIKKSNKINAIFKILYFNILLFSGLIFIFILAIPTLILPSKFTLFFGRGFSKIYNHFNAHYT